PLASEDGYLRRSLLPGMLRALSRNLARQNAGAALFEVGTVFAPGDPVEEREHFGIAMTGSASEGWPEAQRSFDFFDLKGAMETLLARLGVRGWRLTADLRRPFHPGRSASVHVGEAPAGVMGELHPAAAARFDLTGRVGVVELDVKVLRSARERRFSTRDVPRFPPVRRDLAFVVDSGIASAEIERAIREQGGDLVWDCRLFDVFTGPPVPQGKRSLAFAVDFRAADRTLTDTEADGAIATIVEALARDFGAELRSG
ncbi:MAG: phenylalanine--tRNA ligase subunit beta, partial [Actinomycetota bacterium]|nr:phenylalanine--tRNA ligase subunit beta [Actinomycetota bacterium]